MAKTDGGTKTKEPRSRVAGADRSRRAHANPPAPGETQRARVKRGSAGRAVDAADAPATAPVPVEAATVAAPRRGRGRTGPANPPVKVAAETTSVPTITDTAAAEAVLETGGERAGSAPEATAAPAPADAVEAEAVGTEAAVAGATDPGQAVGDATTGTGEEVQTTVLPAPAAATDASVLLQPEPQNVMEVGLKPQDVKGGLAAAVAALPAKVSLPVLQSILIETDGPGHVRLTATDLDTTVTRRIPAVVEEPGAVLVPGKKFNEIVRELPDGCVITMRLKEDTLHLWCQATRTRYKLPTMPRDEFPNPPGILWEGNAFAVDGATLGMMIERTSFATSTEETRPILNGVLWEFGEEEMGMVATNGHRLSSTYLASDTAAGRPEAIIHPRALGMVARLPAEGELVQVARTENHIGFRGDGWEIITRLLEGPYPDFRQVLPKDNDKVLVADKAALAAALRRMVIVASEQTHRVKFTLGEPTQMRMSVETSDIGTAHEDVAVEYAGDPVEIGFNAEYLLEMLRYIPAGEVRMTFKASDRAATLAPVDDDSGARTAMLVMPLRLL